MGKSEQEILREAQKIHEQGNLYHKLRNFIYSNHGLCETDEIKLKLLKLWDDSLYQEFINSRSHLKGHQNENNQPLDHKSILSSSMRYKLRKKNPCPIELENEMRVKNARLPKPVHDGLNSWLKKHQENPYPNKAEKEALSAKLGITPQQVNRWFIQRRKMLRIRGKLYLGRGITDTPSDNEGEEEEEEYMEDEEDHKSAVFHLIQGHHDQFDENGSLLEKILSGSPRNSPNPSQNNTTGRSSGGSVIEIMERNRFVPLTPPPSISGDSNARSTPPEIGYTVLDCSNGGLDHQQQQALDLSHAANAKSSPIILEPVSPPWRKVAAACNLYHKTDQYDQEKTVEMDRDELIAAQALMVLAGVK